MGGREGLGRERRIEGIRYRRRLKFLKISCFRKQRKR